MYIVNEKILQTPVEEGNMLLLEPCEGLYFEMNEISVLIYQSIASGLDKNDILKSIVAKYEVEKQQALIDLNAHIDHLLANNIISQIPI